MHRRDGMLVVGFALLLRLLVAVLWQPDPVTDASDYLRMADGLLDGQGLVNTRGELTSWRPPGYPAVLAGALALGGGGQWVMRLVQALAATGSVWLVILLGRLWLTRSVAVIAGLLAAINLAHIFAVSRLLSETLFVTLLLGGVYLLSRGLKERPSQAWPFMAGAGCLMALGTLLRSVLLPFPGLVVLFLIGTGRRRAMDGVVLAVAFAATLAPWTIRNYQVHEAFVPVATQVGATLYAGNHPRDGFVFGVMADDPRTAEADRLSEVAASKFLTSVTMEDWAANPWDLPRLVALKVIYFWVPADWELLPWYGVFNPTYGLLLCGLLAGAILSRGATGPQMDDSDPRSGPRLLRTWSARGTQVMRLWPLWLPVAYFLVVAVVFYGSPRLRMPVEPFLGLGAASGYEAFRVRFGKQRAQRWVLCATVSLLALVGVWGPVKAIGRGLLTLGGQG